MPIQELSSGSGLGSAIGTAAGYLMGNNQRKEAEQDRQAQIAERSAASKRADQELALNVAAGTRAQTTFKADEDRLALVAGVKGNMNKPANAGGIGPPPGANAKPEEITQYILRGRAYAIQNGVDPVDIGFGPSDINAMSLLNTRAADVGLKGAQTKNYASQADWHQAQAQHIRDYAQEQQARLQGDLQKIGAQTNGRVKVAQVQSAGAYARAQMAQSGANQRSANAQGGANARAAASLEEREAVANSAMAFKAADLVAGISEKSDAQYAATARNQYDQQMANWRNENTVTKGAGPDSGGGMPGQPDYASILAAVSGRPQAAPNISVSVPGQAPPDNTLAQIMPIIIQALSHGGSAAPGSAPGKPPTSGNQGLITHLQSLIPKPAAPAKPAARLPAAQEVKNAKAAGVDDATIRSTLKAHGYSDAEIESALPQQSGLMHMGLNLGPIHL